MTSGPKPGAGGPDLPLLWRRPAPAPLLRTEAAPRLRSDQGCIWIASFPRSGNTWMLTFISNLLHVSRGVAPAGINHLKRSAIWEASVDTFREVMGKNPLGLPMREIARARPRVQELLAARANGRIFLKTHLAALKVEGEFAINWKVTRGAVYLVRNPLDVACSYAPHYGISVDQAIKAMGEHDLVAWGKTMVIEATGSWSVNVASWTDQKLPLPVHVIRYEDMVEKPSETFSAFVRHIGGGITDQQIAKAIELSSFENVKKQEEEAGFRMRPRVSSDAFFRKGKTGQWRETLTRAQVDRIVADHSVQMQRFGYLDEL